MSRRGWRGRVRPLRAGRGRDRGSTTAELAAALPALALLLFVGVAAVAATQTKLRCADAARDAALAAARGQEGTLSGTSTAPDGATITVTVQGDTVTATVRASARVAGTRLPAIDVSATAVAEREPDLPW
ncbi:TadE family type IV pilus minor pilin [Asanoa siamensis]|uniref:TadE-like protein n=1 Tax=Asanoa siamensis TaxID=926357 RepID=A0ABQ4CRZ3_9ACTN|nr:TadE family type IV pilus minor pilin [Asanoa siamensis]GIF74069.1 hypothetical protein Asi02nite_35870 [Asanoa siamensis]